jgi:hypothetical protein
VVEPCGSPAAVNTDAGGSDTEVAAHRRRRRWATHTESPLKLTLRWTISVGSTDAEAKTTGRPRMLTAEFLCSFLVSVAAPSGAGGGAKSGATRSDQRFFRPQNSEVADVREFPRYWMDPSGNRGISSFPCQQGWRGSSGLRG